MRSMTKLAALVCAAGAAASANAVVLTSTSFEAPTYVAGNLGGQNGWIVGGSSGTTSSNRAVVQNNAANARTGSQYVNVDTSAWTADSSSATYRLSYSYVDNSAAFLANIATKPLLHAGLGIRMNTQTGTRSNYGTLDIYGFVGGVTFTHALSMGLYSPTTSVADSRVYIYNPANANAIVISNGTTGWLNAWHMFDIYMNYNTGVASFSVDGVSLDSILDGAGYLRTFDTTLEFSDADMQAERDRPSAGTSSGGTTIRFDDYLVEMTPAPGSAALFGLAGLVAARRRRA